MREFRLILLVAASLASMCGAEESCPWLNAATAAGVLGGAVHPAVAHASKNADDATCDFVRREGSVVAELRIEVETMGASGRELAVYTARCRTNTAPLQAIGNEAVACSVDGKDGEIAEQVAGRVRSRAFLIRMGTNDPPARRKVLREKARDVAEQVAGTLF